MRVERSAGIPAPRWFGWSRPIARCGPGLAPSDGRDDSLRQLVDVGDDPQEHLVYALQLFQQKLVHALELAQQYVVRVLQLFHLIRRPNGVHATTYAPRRHSPACETAVASPPTSANFPIV